MRNPNYENYPGIDCSEIAQDLYYTAGGEGIIYRITGIGDNGLINGFEYGNVSQYIYHEVYSDGTFIFDPRYDISPVPKDVYFGSLRTINPEGFYVTELSNPV